MKRSKAQKRNMFIDNYFVISFPLLSKPTISFEYDANGLYNLPFNIISYCLPDIDVIPSTPLEPRYLFSILNHQFLVPQLILNEVRILYFY